MRILRVAWAFLARDFLMASSYRLAFAIQVGGLGLTVVSIYFMARLVGQNPSTERYGGYLPFALVGMAVSSYFTTGFTSFASSLRREQMMGTLEAILMTPVRLPALIIASSIWSFIWTTLSAVIVIGTARFFFDVTLQGNLLGAFLLLVLTTLTFSCLGILSASFTMVFKRGDPTGYLAGSLSFLLGGVVYPIDLLPQWLQKISQLLPITHGLRGIRDLILAGHDFRSVFPQIAILLVFIAVGAPLSFWIFALSVTIARREGSLVHY